MENFSQGYVQYGDMSGKAAVDFHDGSDHFKLAKKLHAKGFPIAIRIHQGFDLNTLNVSVYATTIAGSADDLQKYAREHGGKIPAIQYRGNLTLAELFEYVKRLDVVLQSRLIPQAEIEYEWAEETDEE